MLAALAGTPAPLEISMPSRRSATTTVASPHRLTSRWLRPLTLAGLVLAAPIGVGTALVPSVATAQAKPFNAPLVALVPGGEIVADGQSEVTLSFVSYFPNGKPMSGMSGKVSGGLGDGKLTEVQPGIYQASVRPSAVTQRGNASVTVKAKTPGGTVEQTFSVAVAPPSASALAITASPDKVVLGRDNTVSLSIQLKGGNVDGGDIQVLASAGEVRSVTPLGNGQYVAQYTPPSQQFPQLALLTAVDRRNPSRTFGHAVVPLVGQANFPVKGEPNASIIVQVGSQPFGPVPSDAQGMAQVPITVAPGTSSAKVISVVNGKRLEDPLDLQVPPSQRVALFPVGAAVPADNGVQIPVRALVRRPDGAPDPKATVSFTAGSGTVSAVTHEGNGIYAATWTPAFGSASSKASIQVSVADAKGPQSDSLELTMVPGRAASLAIAAEPPTLGTNTNNFKLYVKANGGPSGLSGRSLVIDSAGADAAGAPRDLGSGDYEVAFTTTDNTSVDVAVGVASEATGNPLSRVLVLPLSGQVAADGRSLQRLAVITVDAYGYPVANVPVNLQVASGDGAIPGSVTTGNDGIAFATYTAGSGAGFVTVRASSNGKVGEGGFVQANGTVQTVDAPVSGTAAVAAMTRGWQGSVGSIAIARAGGAVAAAPVVTQGPAGPPAALSLTAEPASAAPGGAVTLRIAVADANGKPADANPADFVFLTSTGTVSAAQATGPGQFQALLSLPADAAGGVNVAASIKGTTVGAPILSIPVTGAVASAWGTAPPANTEPTQPEQPEKPEKPAKPEKVKKERKPSDTDRAWFRAGGGYLGGFYSYREISQQAAGPIYDEPITVGFGEGNAAGTFGMQANAKAWLPFFEYVGFEAGFRGSRWQIQLDEGGSDPIGDGLAAINARAHGRYPLDVGATRLSFGGFLGFHSSDFLYFTQEFDETDPTAEPTIGYDQLWTVGNSYGIELGAEIGPKFFVNGLYEMGFTDYSAIFSDTVELEAGYTVIDNMYIFGNAGRAHRVSKIYYGDNKDYVGDIEDQQWFFGLGLGYEM